MIEQHRQRSRGTKTPNAQVCAGTSKTCGRAGHGAGAGGARTEKTVIGYVKQRRKSVPVGARQGSLDFNF